MSVLSLQDGVVYQTYATAARGVEFLMGYYPILDRVTRAKRSKPGSAATTNTPKTCREKEHDSADLKPAGAIPSSGAYGQRLTGVARRW